MSRKKYVLEESNEKEIDLKVRTSGIEILKILVDSGGFFFFRGFLLGFFIGAQENETTSFNTRFILPRKFISLFGKKLEPSSRFYGVPLRCEASTRSGESSVAVLVLVLWFVSRRRRRSLARIHQDEDEKRL